LEIGTDRDERLRRSRNEKAGDARELGTPHVKLREEREDFTRQICMKKTNSGKSKIRTLGSRDGAGIEEKKWPLEGKRNLIEGLY